MIYAVALTIIGFAILVIAGAIGLLTGSFQITGWSMLSQLLILAVMIVAGWLTGYNQRDVEVERDKESEDQKIGD